MSPKDVSSFFVSEHFRPVIIFMADGSSHRVGHPNHALVVGGMVFIGQEPDSDNVPTKAVHLNLRQITRIEPATADAA